MSLPVISTVAQYAKSEKNNNNDQRDRKNDQFSLFLPSVISLSTTRFY